MQSGVILNIYKTETVLPKYGVWRTYDASNGIPGGVWCLLQDRKGYLWVGTRIGLCHYDGTKFVTYRAKDGVTNNDVLAIHEDPDGTLWLGTSDGLINFDGEHFTTYTTKNGLPANNIRSVMRDKRGRLWISTLGEGVSFYDGEKFTNYNKKNGLPSNHIITMREDLQGRIWFATYLDGVSCFDGEHFINYNTSDGLDSNIAWSLCLDHRGILWVGTSKGISYFDNNNLHKFEYNDELINKNIHYIYEDRKGCMWFGTLGGVSCFDGRRINNYTTEHGLLDNRLSGMIQDREGGFWFSHTFGGLTYFNPEMSVILTSEPVSESIIQDKLGRLWFSNENVLHCLTNNQQFSWNFNARIFSIMEDSSGYLWIGTFGDGLYRYRFDELLQNVTGTRFTVEDGLGTNKIQGLLETKDGTIWVGTAEPGCLCRYDGARFDSIETKHGAVFRIFEDSHGLIWMGGWANGGLSCYDGQKLKNYNTTNGLPNSKIQSILEDDNGYLWFGTQNGLCRFDGNQFTNYGKDNGIVSFFHQCSAKDIDGRLWFGTLGGGLYYTDGDHFQWLTQDNGLPNNSIIGIIPQSNGSIIVGTYHGIAVYKKTSTIPPEIEIREIVTDRVYQQTIKNELTAVKSSVITIAYHGMGFGTQRMLYSYILEGYDDKWHDTWDTHVRYENLPIGRYTFKVIAINHDLLCSEKPAILNINITANPWDRLRSEYEAEIKRMQKVLEISYRIHSQPTLSDAARVIVESLQELGFDRAGVWILEPGYDQLHGLCGTDINGNIYDNRDEYQPLSAIPSDGGYTVDIDKSILIEKLGIDDSTVYLIKGRDENLFELIWGYQPPCAGYYRRDASGDNICISFTSEDKRVGIIAVDNYITKRNIDETSANLLSMLGTKMAETLARMSLSESLQKSEETAKAILNATDDLELLIDTNGKIITLNKAFAERFSKSVNDFMGLCIYNLMPPDIAEIYRLQVEKAINSGESIRFESEIQRIYLDNSVYPIINAKGEVETLAVYIRDITERKLAEKALRESEEKYRLVVENAREVIAVFQDMETKYINSRITDAIGYSRDEVISKSFMDFVHPDDREMVLKNNAKALMGDEFPSMYPFRIIDKFGNIRWAEVSASKITWEGKPAILAILDDITEKRGMEAEVLRMQKLDSLSVLAGGIAHDLNNLLSAVVGNISLAEMYLQTEKPKERTIERLVEADKASSRIRDLTQQLLTFSKGGAPVKELATIGDIIKDSANFAIRGSNTKCIFSIPDDLWSAEVDTGQVSQVINNIVINADQAMPNGGTINICAENIHVGMENNLPLKEGPYIKISIKDQGIGIPETIINRIFDPFFTTKQKGSGLGLAASYSIIKNHNGYITAESNVGVDTTFYIYLPASLTRIQGKVKEEGREYTIGEGRILLMDDEEYIIDVATEIMSNLGYSVVSSRNGAEAYETYKMAKESGNPFDAVIIDLTVPGGMGGSELIQKLLKIDPEVKAIVSSGYSNDPIISNFENYGFKGFITKPYRIKEINQTLHEVLANTDDTGDTERQ